MKTISKDDKSNVTSAKSDSKDGKEATSDSLKENEKDKKEKEPDFEMLQNPTRVIKPQVKFN